MKYIQGYGGDVAPPNNRFYAGGEADVRGFDIRTNTPYAYIPNKISFNLTNPDGTCVPRDPTNPQLNQCIQVLLPVYSVVSVGGDLNFTNNLEYRIPIAGPVTFAFFNDFGIDSAVNRNQLQREPRRRSRAERSSLRLPGLQQRNLRRWNTDQIQRPDPAVGGDELRAAHVCRS